MALTAEQAQAMVAKGVALLDEHLPNWGGRIDVGQLDLSSERLCILGQLSGGSWICLPKDFTLARHAQGGAEATGFDSPSEAGNDWKDDCSLLQDAWIAAIAERVVPKAEPRTLSPEPELSPLLAHPAVREGR